MTINEAYGKLLDNLKGIYDDREAANIAAWVFENVTEKKKIDRIINKNLLLNSIPENTLADYTRQLLQHKPVQYVLNEAWFAGLKLYVDEAVLIPRPETEELVEWIISDVRCTMSDVRNRKSKVENDSDLSIIDVGTGSGCIPLALKSKLPEADISAIDISEEALHVAKKNAETHRLKINFCRLDFLNREEWKSLEKYDIIVSNPPYIKQSEEAMMNKNVLEHEPHVALFVPDEDALIFYKALAEFAQLHLKPEGNLYVEINETLGQQVTELFKEHNFANVIIRKDLQGKDRMVKSGLS